MAKRIDFEDGPLNPRSSTRTWITDGLVAFAATAIVQVNLFFPGPEARRSSLGDALFDLLLTLPLFFRSRAPFAVMTVILGAAIAPPLLGGLGSNGLSWIPLAVSVYSVGSLANGKLQIAGLAIQPIGALATEIVLSDSPSLINFVLQTALLVAAWFAGDQVRARRRYIVNLEERAERLASHSDEDTRRIVADERSRIARELHDVITHSVTAIAVQAGAARMNFDTDKGSALQSLGSIEAGSRQALVEMRRLLGLLRTDDDRSLALAPQPTLSRLDALVEQIGRAGVDVELQVHGQPARLSPGLDLSAYRVIEEALSGASKAATKARVRVFYKPTDIELEVSYPTSESESPSFAGIRERVALFGGDFEARAHPEGEFVVRARMPVAA
jgi:signal transduction histidine kinase